MKRSINTASAMILVLGTFVVTAQAGQAVSCEGAAQDLCVVLPAEAPEISNEIAYDSDSKTVSMVAASDLVRPTDLPFAYADRIQFASDFEQLPLFPHENLVAAMAFDMSYRGYTNIIINKIDGKVGIAGKK